MANIPVYYHVDVSASCFDDLIPDNSEAVQKYDKYARATQNITMYGLTSVDIPFEGEIPEQQVSIEVLQSKDVPDYLRERLITKYMSSRKEKKYLGLNRTSVEITKEPLIKK